MNEGGVGGGGGEDGSMACVDEWLKLDAPENDQTTMYCCCCLALL